MKCCRCSCSGLVKRLDVSRSTLPHSPPFSSIGFGRVTLGRERFLEYSAERFARSAIDRMLFAHAEEDPQFERMTESEYIKKAADSEYQGFATALAAAQDGGLANIALGD